MVVASTVNSQAVAISVIQDGDEIAVRSKTGSADAWQGFYTALMSLKSCSPPSCGTPSTAATEASLSEIASSHGGSSPRKLAWDIELEEEFSDSDIEAIDEDSELIHSSSSKRTRRRANRRRRTRGGRRSAARRARLAAERLEGCDTIHEETLPGSVAATPSSRDVVLLGDLHLGLDSPAVTDSCPAQSTMPIVQADFLGPLCHSKVGCDVSTSAGPCNTVDTVSRGSDASARVPAPSSMPTATSPCQVHASSYTVLCARPCANSAISTQDASTRQGIALFPSTAAWPMQPCLPQQIASIVQVTPLQHPAPNGSQAPILISSPCPAWAAPAPCIVSTSPMAARGPCVSSGVATAGAGSQSADILRSWLQASGLPSAADIAAHLQAAAPDFYED